MRVNRLRIAQGLGAGVLVLLGAGCTAIVPDATTSEEIDFHAGAAFTIEQTWFGINTPQREAYGKRNVTVDEWAANESTTLSWTMTSRQETEASVAAREAASQVPIGEEASVPDPVYEDVTTTGSVMTDALNNAERILLPSYWPQGAYDVRGEENSVVWLSRQQYDELVSTRSSHIAIGLFDATLQNLIDFGEGVSNALAKLQGELAAQETSNTDITKLEAEGDWGSMTLTVNGEPTTVRTIAATSAFADYVILANPENPLILKVSIKPLSLGFGMLSTLSVVKSLAGYEITSLTY
ncbi:hypothetical protein HYS28_01035 [Candidatus Uhrbacteria bacterium]|nr:hypothetical protein [Candidatus Uhrbacteria bacterium]